MLPQRLLVEKNRGVGTIIINHPEKNNALSPDLVEELVASLQNLSEDDAVRVLVIRGEGDKAFCAGYDIGSLKALEDEDVDAHIGRLGRVEKLFKAILEFPYPVIAMLNGVAFGAGFELAICADIRIGADDIRVGMPPAKLGIVYPWRGLKRFVEVLGQQATKKMFFTGDTYKGKELLEMGLVDDLVNRNELASITFQMARAIAANSPLALKGMKKILQLISETWSLSGESQDLAESLNRRSFLSEDAKEGQRAFFEKRSPLFKGR